MRVFSAITALLTVGIIAVRGATWVAVPDVPPGEPQSLVSCVALAQPEDTIILLSGMHQGPVEVSKSLCIRADVPGEAIVWAFRQPMSVTSGTVILSDFVVLSEMDRAPEHFVLELAGAEAHLEGLVVACRGVMGTGLQIKDDSHVTLSRCDFTNSPLDHLIRLVSCPNNVIASDCTWPYAKTSVLARVIWDKDDDPALGQVVY